MTNQTIEEAVEELSKDWLFAGDEPKEDDFGIHKEFKDFLRQALQAQRDAGAGLAEIKSELQSDSFSGCILGILQDFASIQEPTNKHYLEASTRVSNAALFYANIDGGKIMFNTIEEALTPLPDKE